MATERPLNLLYVIPATAIESGSSVQLFHLATELRRRGHRISILARRKPDEDGSSLNRFHEIGCELATVEIERSFRRETFRLIRSRLRTGKFDVAHAIKGRALDHLYLASMGLRRRPPIVTTRGMQHPLNWLNSIKYKSSRVARIIAVTESVKETMIRTGGVPPDKIQVIYQSIDVSRFDRREVAGAREAVRSEFGIPLDAQVVGMVANLAGYKRYDVFLESIAIAARINPRLHAMAVGRGNVEKYRAMARELDVADRVTFTGFRADVPRLLAAMDVMALTSENEAFGGSRLEALAMGIPVVTTDGGGSRELIRDGETGRIVPPGDGAAVAGAINELLRDDSMRKRMGDAGALEVRSRFTVEAKADAYERVYATVMGAQ